MIVESERSEHQDVKTKESIEAVCTKDSQDYLVTCIGAFGAWQARVCILACVSRLMIMWNLMNVIFLTHDTEFICTSFNSSTPENVTVSTCYDGCTNYEFSDGLFQTNFVEEFDLICDKAWIANLLQSMLMFGFMFGVIAFGWISDRYGRRKALILATFGNVMFMMGSPFSPNHWVYVALRFFVGLASGGILVVGVVVILEVVGPQHREIASSLINIPDGIAEASLCAFVYFSPTWRLFLLSLGVVSILILASLVFLPETPRWLMANRRLDEMRKLMMYAAKCNSIDAAVAEDNINKSITTSPCETKTKSHYWDLFRTAKMALKTLIVLVIWVVSGFSYFGINQYTSFLGSNIYISVTTLGLIQVPACLVAIWLNKMMGRKISMISTMLTTSICMLLLIFTPPDHWIAIFLGVAGTSAATMQFNIVYVYTSELYPTEVRNMAFGIGGMGSKVGAVVAPFVATLSPHWIPSVVFAVLPLVAAGISLTLPETKGQKLPDHLD